MYDLFTAFDYAASSVHLEERPSTAVAPQALLLLNSPLLREQSAAFGAQVRAAAADDTARLAFAYGAAFGREPAAGELDRCRAFLAAACVPADAAAPPKASHRPSHVLLS